MRVRVRAGSGLHPQQRLQRRRQVVDGDRRIVRRPTCESALPPGPRGAPPSPELRLRPGPSVAPPCPPPWDCPGPRRRGWACPPSRATLLLALHPVRNRSGLGLGLGSGLRSGSRFGVRVRPGDLLALHPEHRRLFDSLVSRARSSARAPPSEMRSPDLERLRTRTGSATSGVRLGLGLRRRLRRSDSPICTPNLRMMPPTEPAFRLTRVAAAPAAPP